MIPIDANSASYAAARAVHFGACLLLPTVFIFDRLIMTGAGGAGALWQRQWTRISRWLVLLALPMALLSGIAWMVFVSMGMSDLSFADASRLPALREILSETQFGSLWKMRLGLWLATALFATPFLMLRGRTAGRAMLSWLGLIASALLAVSAARAGHGADGSRWHQAADATHLLIGAAWPIGLVPLALLMIAARRTIGIEKWTAVAPVVQRFSLVSICSVLLIGTSGFVNAAAPIGRWSNLFSTAYGQVLLIKIACFGVMILLGAMNMLYLRPRLSLDYRASNDATRTRALRRLQLSVWLEIVLGIAVLLAAGLLGTLEPACDKCCCG